MRRLLLKILYRLLSFSAAGGTVSAIGRRSLYNPHSHPVKGLLQSTAFDTSCLGLEIHDILNRDSRKSFWVPADADP